MRDPREGLAADGSIRTGVSRERIPAEFASIIANAVDAFHEVGDDSGALLLYGSVATGTARVGQSDVDLIAIGASAEWCRDVSRYLSERFSHLCRGVEIGHADLNDSLGNGDEAYGNRVFLRHYCTCLAGLDTAASMPPFLGDARAARGFNGDIVLRLTQWREGKARARSVARKTLLAAAGIVSILDKTWTTDRGIAAYRWAEIEPDDAPEAAMLLRWVDDDGAATTAELDAVLAPYGLVANVADRFADTIGLWQ